MIRTLYKFALFSFFIAAFFGQLHAQVAIGHTDPSPSSLLDINATDKGVLIPRVSIADLNDQAPIKGQIVESMFVYNTNTATGTGFYYWKESKWNRLRAGGEQNIYTTNGKISQDRDLDLNGHTLNFKQGNTQLFRFNSNGSLRLSSYGKGKFYSSDFIQFLGVNALGELVELEKEDAIHLSNRDWYGKNSLEVPKSIDDTIWTNGQVGINTKNPSGTLHIYESTGSPVNADQGSLVLEHGNSGGQSSIIFKSTANASSDYGYIKYQDDGNLNGSSTENGLLTLGVENDIPGNDQDDINISATGSVGIRNTNPDPNASLDLGQTDRGLLINRVRLTDRISIAPFKNTPTDGILVINIATAGQDENKVIPGFYYWYQDSWNLLQTAGFENNIYNSNGMLTSNRTLNMQNHNLTFANSNDRPLSIIPPDPTDDMAPFKFFTNNALVFEVDHPDQTFELGSNGKIRLGKYGKGSVLGSATYSLGVDSEGNIIEKEKNTGLQFYSYYLGTFDDHPDVSDIRTNLVPRKSGHYTGLLSSQNRLISSTKPTENDYFVIKFIGYYYVKIPGNFEISMQSDDGARVYIDGTLAQGTWYGSSSSTVRTSIINLSRGKHQFEFWYYEKTGDEAVEFRWGNNPDGNTGLINAKQFTID